MASRILIISTNREMSPQPTVPVGAAWVAEALHQAGFVVGFLDLCFAREPLKRIAGVLKSFEPDGIGISVRNVDNGDFLSPRSFIPELKTVTDFIKENTAAPILLGGPGISVMPAQILDYLGLDFAIVGEGEEAAVQFFSSESPGNSCRIPGLVRREDGGLPEERGDWLPNPDLVRPRMHNWIEVNRYMRFEPVLPVQGKRGCANRCLYCTYNRIEGRTWRLRDPAVVAEEISNAIYRTHARTFEFVDSIFNQPEGYMERLLEEIIKWQLKAKFHVASMSPKGLTKSQVKLMERAGITAVGITPEAAADETLNSLRKGFSADEVNRSLEVLRGSKVRALWCFLLGGPKETEKTLTTTINFINKIPAKDTAFITSGVRIYPQTGMHELALQEGVVTPADSLLMPTFYFTPEMKPERARQVMKSGLKSIDNCIFLSETQSAQIGPLRRIGTALRLPSPFWRYAGYMNMMFKGNRLINRKWQSD